MRLHLPISFSHDLVVSLGFWLMTFNMSGAHILLLDATAQTTSGRMFNLPFFALGNLPAAKVTNALCIAEDFSALLTSP